LRPPCRSHALGASSALPSFASPYVDTIDDAVFVVDASVGGAASFGTVALLLDDDDRLLTAVECAGCDSPARVLELCSVLLAAAPAAGEWRRLVVASSWPGDDDVGGDVVGSWRSLARACGSSPVELVDWLVLDLPAGVVRSVREVAEGRFPW
jgi:hypothetical protein